MDKNTEISKVQEQIKALRQRINNSDYENLQEKHELEKQRWLLKKHLAALKAGLDTFIVQ